MRNTNTTIPVMMDHVRELLEQGRPQEALKCIEHLGQKTPATENARGVCLLRMGKKTEAMSVLREVAFQGYVCMPSDTPVLHQINFATALLLCNSKDAAFNILNKLKENPHPQITKLKDAVHQWTQGLSVIEKCGLYMGFYPQKPIAIEFPPGEI